MLKISFTSPRLLTLSVFQFINTAMGYAAASVSDDLHSCTRDIDSFNCFHPTIPGRRVVFVDTPGFDNTMGKDSNTIRHVATWLKQT